MATVSPGLMPLSVCELTAAVKQQKLQSTLAHCLDITDLLTSLVCHCTFSQLDPGLLLC